MVARLDDNTIEKNEIELRKTNAFVFVTCVAGGIRQRARGVPTYSLAGEATSAL